VERILRWIPIDLPPQMGESPVAVQFKIPKPRDYNSVQRRFKRSEQESTIFFSTLRSELQEFAITRSPPAERLSKDWRRKSQLKPKRTRLC